MSEPSKKLKTFSVLWALLIGGVVIVLAGSVLLPSTKRARIDFDKLRQDEAAEQEQIDAEAATAPATVPR